MKTSLWECVAADRSAYLPGSGRILQGRGPQRQMVWKFCSGQAGELLNKKRGWNEQEQIQAEDRTINTHNLFLQVLKTRTAA